MLAGALSIVALCLGLLAATIGGSFNLDGDEALLMALFGIMGISGFVAVKAKSEAGKKPSDQ